MKRFSFLILVTAALALGCDPGAPGKGGVEGQGGAPSLTPQRSPGQVLLPRPCDPCSAALIGDVERPLCAGAQAGYEDLLVCACQAACASVCNVTASDDCLAGWDGNPPLACKACLLSATGCGAAWGACLFEEGVSAPPESASSGVESSCSCDPALPLCPGGGSCATPGAFDAPGNAACGSAEYCAPCCDPGNPCAVQGACTVTGIAQAPCSADYACCSGVCTEGACEGGCGIVLSF